MAYINSKATKNFGIYIAILIIVCLSLLNYLNSLSNKFVYDDEFVIVNNYFIKTWDNFPRLFNKDYFRYAEELSYRPVVTLSYFIDYSIWGLNPFGFHLTNLLLHTLNSVLIFFLFTYFLNNRTVSFVAALLFVCHPILSETVNAISYREDLLTATFFIAAFILYIKTSKRDDLVLKQNSNTKTRLLYSASLICSLFAVFSKEMAIILPALIFLYDFVLTKKKDLPHKLIHNYIGYILIAIFYLIIRFVILYSPVEAQTSYPSNSVLINAMTMTKVIAYYMELFFLPLSLCADYVMPHASFLDISFILSLLLVCSVILIAYKLYTYSKIVFFSIAWFSVSLLPVLNIVPIENIIAERYLYLPILGLCMSYGRFLQIHTKFKNYQKYTIIILLILILLPLSLKTIKRNKIWMEQSVLWTDTVRTSPNSFKAHNNLGNFYRDAGMLDESIIEFKRALSLYDDYINAHNNLGVTYRKKGMLKEALTEYQKALKLNPNYAYAHNNLGVLYAKLNYLDLSIVEFQKAISIMPYYFDAHNNLGATYLRKGLHEKAIAEFLETIKYNNRHADAYYNLSAAYLSSNQLNKALDAIKIVLSIDPNHTDAREVLNTISMQMRQTEKRN